MDSVDPAEIEDRTGHDYQPELAAGVDPLEIRLESLWEINDRLVATVSELDHGDELDRMGPDGLVDFFTKHGCGDLFVRWTDEQRLTSAAEGKIPRLDNWQTLLAGKVIALDSLMNLAGLNSFIKDQAAMDKKVQEVLAGVRTR